MEEKHEFSKNSLDEFTDEFWEEFDKMLLWIRDKMKPWKWYPEKGVLTDKAIDTLGWIIGLGFSNEIEFSADLNKVRKCENF